MPRSFCLAAAMSALSVIFMFPAGCARSLFADNDAATEWKLRRYYDNDSARLTSEGRRQGSSNGFGLPIGKSSQ